MTSAVATIERVAVPLSWFCGLLLVIRASERHPPERRKPMRGWQLVIALVFCATFAQLFVDDWRPFAGDAAVVAISAMIATQIARSHAFPSARLHRSAALSC